MPNAKIKNIPVVSPTDMWLPTISLTISRMISKLIKMTGNACEGTKYIASFLTSNLDVFIKKTEHIIPIKNASKACIHSIRKAGIINIHEPVAIMIGGKIIFFTEAGFFAAFNRTTIQKLAITANRMVLAIIQNIKSLFQYRIRKYQCGTFTNSSWMNPIFLRFDQSFPAHGIHQKV